MPTNKANLAQFFFKCGSLDLATFAVVNFSGTDAISTPYSFTIILRSSRDDIAPDEVVNKQSTLYMNRDEDCYPYSGIVREFRYLETTVDYSLYEVVLVPRLQLLEYNIRYRVFQRMDVTQIIKQVLDDANLTRYYSFEVQGSYPQRELVVQYQESDLNFITRLMEEAGLWYFFKETCVSDDEVDAVSNESIVITNKPASFQFIQGDSQILFRTESGLNEMIDTQDRESLSQLSSESRIIPNQVVVNNYNYRAPEVPLSTQKPISNGMLGVVHSFGQEFRDTDGAESAAQVMANRLASMRSSIRARGNCRGFRAGCRFELQSHKINAFNDRYLITRVIHSGGHSSLGGKAAAVNYDNVVEALPSAFINQYQPPQQAHLPRINGIITAPIEASGSEYAMLDEMGRYKVRLPFDLSDTGNAEASKYVRLAQPYAGSNYGMHFPSHEGAEMVLACIDGNPNRILGLGTVPNANTISPVVSNNKTQNVIRTAGQNEILLEDQDGKQKIQLTTKAANAAALDDENKRILITTTDGNQLLLDDGNKKCVWNAQENNITMDYENKKITITSAKGHVIEINDDSDLITIQSAGGHSVQMDDGAKTIVLEDGAGKNNVTLDGNSGLMLKSQGKIAIEAQQDLEIKAANVKITANAALQAQAGSDLKLKGMNVEAKADMNAKLEGGMNMEVKGGMQGKFSGGTMAEFSGGAMTKVKGGIVMIN